MAINLSLGLRGNWKYKYIHKALSPRYQNELVDRISLLKIIQVCLNILLISKLMLNHALFLKQIQYIYPLKVNGIVCSERKIHGPQLTNEYRKEAVYPPIKKFKSKRDEEEVINFISYIVSRGLKCNRVKWDSASQFFIFQANLIENVRKLDTVEEKLYYMNKPKYYGWQSYIIDASKIRPTSLDFVQYITNTTLVENELPPIYNLKTSSGKELETLQGKTDP